MININTNWIYSLGMGLSAFLFLTHSLTAGITVEAKKSLTEFIQECPWIGLVASEITYGPITISEVNIHDGDKLAVVAPGEILNGMLKYRVDSKDLQSLHLYHLVIGIKGQGPQDCITHNLGMWSSEGKGRFTLKAPEKPGIYEVRFLLTQALLCSNARDAWDSDQGIPSSAATIGIIIVD